MNEVLNQLSITDGLTKLHNHRFFQDHLTREIPVVVISADATTPQVKRLLSAGARYYLTKPIDIAEFFRVVDKPTSIKSRLIDGCKSTPTM